MKQVGKRLLSLLLALCMMMSLCVSALAVNDVTVTATLDTPTLYRKSVAQTVKLRVATSEPITICDYQVKLKLPEGWTVTAMENDDANAQLVPADYNLATGSVVWNGDGEDHSVTNFVIYTVEIPADTKAGRYELSLYEVEANATYGTKPVLTSPDNNTSATLTIKDDDTSNLYKDYCVAFYTGGGSGQSTLQMGTDKNVVSLEVLIQNGIINKGQTYNAYGITLSYDPTILEFVKVGNVDCIYSVENDKVNGTVTVYRSGTQLSCSARDGFFAEFKGIATGSCNVAITRAYHKTDGVLFYHMVQSFPKGEAVDPVTAHAAALKLAEYYEGYEVLVCTHTDREHIHSHFLINSVNFDTGRKLHIAKEQLQELRQRNDMVCKEFSLPVFQPREQKQKTKTMTIGEYHTAARGQSKKLQLMNIINDCMRHASNREEFIALMESEGYKVRWEKSRKNITYTTPSGWQCRNRLLFGDKYLKENMEYEFRIREEIIYGRAHGPEPARAFTAADSAGVEFTDHAHCHPVSAAGGSDDADTEDRIHRVGSAWNAGVSSEPEITHRPDSGAEQHGGDPEIVDGDDHSAGTGWEEERKAFLQMAGLASGLRPDRSGQMDRTGTAHRGGTAGDGVWHSDSGQQHPQPVSMKPLHAGLYGLAVTGALLDDGNEDVEERYRRIQAEQEAKNIGAVIGLVAGVAMVLTQDEQSSTEQQWTEDQQAEQTQQQTM